MNNCNQPASDIASHHREWQKRNPATVVDILRGGDWFILRFKRWHGFSFWRLWDGSVRVNFGYFVLCGNRKAWK